MACGSCQEKALKAERERIERELMARDNARVSSTVSSDRDYAKAQTKGCMIMHDSLTQMDRDVVALYKEHRMKGGLGFKLLKMQGKIREWIRNLSNDCPPQDEYNEMRQNILDIRNNGDSERKES